MTDYIRGDFGGGRERIMPVEYPPNSERSKKARTGEDKPRVETVATGKVIQRPKGWGYRLLHAFTGDSDVSFGEAILTEILIPAFKRMMSDTADQGLDAVGMGVHRAIYGEPRSRTAYGDTRRFRNALDRNPAGVVPYNRVLRSDPAYGVISSRARAMHDFDEIVFPSRAVATDVLEELLKCIREYGVASVADLYTAAGITGDFPDNKWGWYNLDSATIRPLRRGWSIRLPRTQPIEDD